MNVEAVVRELRATHEARYGQPYCEEIEIGRVRDYLAALDEPVPQLQQGSTVPPLFLLTLGRLRRPQPARGSAVNGGDSFEFHAAVHVGDRIRSTFELVSIEPKAGKRGPMYVSTVRTTYTNQHDVMVATALRRVIRWGLE